MIKVVRVFLAGFLLLISTPSQSAEPHRYISGQTFLEWFVSMQYDYIRGLMDSFQYFANETGIEKEIYPCFVHGEFSPITLNFDIKDGIKESMAALPLQPVSIPHVFLNLIRDTCARLQLRPDADKNPSPRYFVTGREYLEWSPSSRVAYATGMTEMLSHLSEVSGVRKGLSDYLKRGSNYIDLALRRVEAEILMVTTLNPGKTFNVPQVFFEKMEKVFNKQPQE